MVAVKDTPWREAVVQVLKGAGTAMHYTEIAEQIQKQGLRKSLGATPANTVATTISLSVKHDGPETPFIKTEPGRFMYKGAQGSVNDLEAAEDLGEPVADNPVVKCVGMYWNVDRVDWKTKPRLLGRQQLGSASVDFGDQVGVYLLYDRNRVVYVGRAVERPLGVRLSEHLKDRLNGRWDRFSWFGLRGVDESGKLTTSDFTANMSQMISLMEALLIEALEPPLNRKRGDDFSEREYLQVDDPQLAARQQKAMVEKLLSNLKE